MKRKMQRLAFAAKWGGFIAMGDALAPRAFETKKPSRSSILASATPPNPAPVCQMNSRRVPVHREHGWPDELICYLNLCSEYSRKPISRRKRIRSCSE
jgi:hypothetical protein